MKSFLILNFKLKNFFFVIFLLMLSSSLFSQESSLSTRPGPEEVPTPVSIAIYVIDIEYIDNLRQNFTADFLVLVRWKDERLAGRKRTIDLNEIWWPNANVLNGRDLSTLLPKRVEVEEDGSVLYRQRYYGHLAAPLDLRKFPFDEQVLPISIITFGNTPDTIELTFVHDGSGSIDDFSNSDWEISKGVGNVDIFRAFSSGKSKKEFKLPIAHFKFEAKRHVFYYIWKVIVPLLVIVMMSWAVFYFDPIEQVAPQIGLGATSILTLIAFLFSLGKILPPIAYLTKIDFFVYTSLSLVFLAFSEAVVTIKLAGSGRITLAKRIDRISRWAFPLLFILILILFSF